MPWFIAVYTEPDEVLTMTAQAREELAMPEKLLATAGVPFTSIIEVGRSADRIAGTARRIGCAQVLFGGARAPIGRRHFGSVAQQVRHLLGAGPWEVTGR